MNTTPDIALAALLESSRHALSLIIRGLELYAKTKQEPERKLLMSFRQAAMMVLGSLEDYMGVERSIVPQRKR